MAWLSGWSKRIAFEISNAGITEDVTEFPILVCLSQHSGICGYNTQEIFDDLGDNSRKIAATTSDGTTQCYVEVEQWSYVNKKAYLWVRIPTVSYTNENWFYLYWDKDHANNTTYVGAPASVPGKAVWNTEYAAVYHMTSATTLLDSTSNAKNIAVYNSPTLVDTILGKGLTFDGTSQYAEGDISILGSSIEDDFIVDSFTIPAATTANRDLYCEAPLTDSGYNSVIDVRYISGIGFLFYVMGSSSSNYIYKASTASLFTAGYPYHLSMAKYRVSGTDYAKVMTNGFERFSYTTNTVSNVSGTTFGRVNIGRQRQWAGGVDTIAGYFNGTIMDIRLITGTKTDSWYRLNDDSYNDRLITWHPEIRRRIVIDHTKVEHSGSHQFLVCLNDEDFRKRCDPTLRYKDVFFMDTDGNILDSTPTGLESLYPAISRDYQWQPAGSPPLQKTGWPILGRGVSGEYDDYQVLLPCVIKDGSTYKMWYSAYDNTHYRIKYATSTDGIDWVKYGVVLNYGGTYDSTHAAASSVIKDGSTYKMWYSGHNGTTYAYILYATSPDGITWTKSGSPCLTYGGTYESNYITNPCVIRISSTDYRMWYDAYDGTNRRILYATSPDGITWTKQGAVITPTTTASYYVYDSLNTFAPCVIWDSINNEYLMWYTGEAVSGTKRVLVARSKDGATWSKNWLPPSNVALYINTSNSYESNAVGYANVLKDDDGYKMYYGGQISGGQYNCFLARSAFEKYWYVRTTVSTTQDTEIFVCYGHPYYHKYSKSHNVFPYQDGFVGAYLMDREPTSGSPSTTDYSIDCSINKNHGQFYGMSWANHWVGKISRGYKMGSGQYLSLGTSSAMRQSSCIGYSFWMCHDGSTDFRTGCGSTVGGCGYGHIFYVNNNRLGYLWTPTNPATDTQAYVSVSLPVGKWVMISIFIDFANKRAKFFVNDTKYGDVIYNNTLVDWTPITSYNSGQTDAIGACYILGNWYYNNNIISDFQIFNQYKDDEWVYTKYNNQSDPERFCTLTSEKDDEYKWTNTFTRSSSYKYFPLQCREWDSYATSSYLPDFYFCNWISALRIYSGLSSMGCGTAFVSFPISEIKGRSLSIQLRKVGYAANWLYLKFYDGQYDCSNDADFPDGSVNNQDFILKGNGILYSSGILGTSIGTYSNLIDLDRYIDRCSTGYLTIAIIVNDGWSGSEVGVYVQRFQIIERDGSEYMSADLDGTIIYDNDFSDSTVGSYPLHFVTPDPGSSVRTVLDTTTNSNAVELTNVSAIVVYDQSINFGYNMCASFNVRYVSGTYNRWGVSFVNDSSNEVMVACGYANDYIDIYEKVGGVTTRKTGVSFSYGTSWHSVWVTIYGSSIFVQIDSTTIYYTTLSVTSFTAVSISTWSGSVCRMDNLVIRNPLNMGRIGTYNDYGTYGSDRGLSDSHYKLIYGDDFNINQYRWDIYGSTTTAAPTWNIAEHPFDRERRGIYTTSNREDANIRGTLAKYFPHLTHCLISFKAMVTTTSVSNYFWYDSSNALYMLYIDPSGIPTWNTGTAATFPNKNFVWFANVWYQVNIEFTSPHKYKIWINNYYLGEVNLSASSETKRLWSVTKHSAVRANSSTLTYQTWIADYKVYDLTHTITQINPIYTMSGETRELGANVIRQVNTYLRSSGELVNRQLSNNGGTGLFEIKTLNSSNDHYIIALDDDTSPDYNALIFDWIKGSE